MSIQWDDIEEDITTFANSNLFKVGGKYNKRLLKWGNNLITEICMGMDIRKHLQICNITFTTSDSSKTLPDIFLKTSHRFTKVRIGTDYYDIIPLEELNDYDPDHDATGSTPDAFAIEGGRIYVSPMISATVVLENYFRKPVAMADRTGTPDLPDDNDALLTDLLCAGVLRKVFLVLQDLDMVTYYNVEYPRLRDLYELLLKDTNSRETSKVNNY